MSELTGLLYIFGIPLVVVLFLCPLINWLTHMEMTKGDGKHYSWGYGSFKNFKQEFEKYEWDDERWYGKSLWNREHKCEYHASIITFGGHGMVMKTPIDLILVRVYIRRYFKTKYPKYTWS